MDRETTRVIEVALDEGEIDIELQDKVHRINLSRATNEDLRKIILVLAYQCDKMRWKIYDIEDRLNDPDC